MIDRPNLISDLNSAWKIPTRDIVSLSSETKVELRSNIGKAIALGDFKRNRNFVPNLSHFSYLRVILHAEFKSEI